MGDDFSLYGDVEDEARAFMGVAGTERPWVHPDTPGWGGVDHDPLDEDDRPTRAELLADDNPAPRRPKPVRYAEPPDDLEP